MLLRVCLVLSVLALVSSRRVNFYRKDYVYVDEYDAYYKLHLNHEHMNWSSSFLTCDDEGAELFYPKETNEWTVVQKLAQDTADINLSLIFVGIHDQFGIGDFLTVDGMYTEGHPSPGPVQHISVNTHEPFEDPLCAVMNAETGELSAENCYSVMRDISKPFICKKVEDISCPTIDKGYIYNKETRKCYKKSNRLQSWSQAMDTCFMEGGILLVLTSDLEAQIIAKSISDDDGLYYAGFKKIFSDKEFYTVTGRKLQDSGYYRLTSDSKNCGVIRRYDSNTIEMKSVECDTKLPFVCEINISD